MIKVLYIMFGIMVFIEFFMIVYALIRKYIINDKTESEV